MELKPLLADEYADSPLKRNLDRLMAERANGRHGVGIYCCYAPLELIWAAGAVPIGLCATSQHPIAEAETILPANLCPLIKSSFGFIITDTCPFFRMSDVVVAETTCDGKKKMFELIRDKKPMLTLELPQMPDEQEAQRHWEHSVRKLRRFLEDAFGSPISDAAIEEAIREGNQRRRLLLEIMGYARHTPPLINWAEIKEISALAGSFTGESMVRLLRQILVKLEERRLAGVGVKEPDAPRVMVTGCPIGGDAEKVFQVIEESGGVVVVQEACSGIKPLWTMVEEGTQDPLAAIARRYFELPCSCMTPNTRRLDYMDELIKTFRPDVIVDVILNCCHTYNIESHVIKEHAAAEHGLPFLKIETDYSEGDIGQLQTRIGAVLELAHC